MKAAQATVANAEQALARGDTAQAEKLLMQSLVSGPSGRALGLLGRLRLQQRRLADAVPLLQKALQLEPGNIEAAEDLVDVLRRQSKLQAAVNIAEQIVKADASRHRAWMALALCLEQASGDSRGELEKALGFARRAIDLQPGNAGYLRDAIALADKVANQELMLDLLQSLNALEPLSGQDCVVMLSALVRCNRLQEAEGWYQQRFTPGNDLVADFQHASMLLRADRLEELISFARDMASVWPEAASRWSVLHAKACHMHSGATEGLAVARQALVANPDNIELLAQMAMIDAGSLTEAEEQTLNAFLSSKEAQERPLVACSVCFALADLAESQKNYSRQLELLQRGNALRQPLERYVPEEADARIAVMEQCFDQRWADAVKQLPAPEHSGVSPVFLLCMPRSGTTLIEQILCSHSQVTGIGEAGILHEAILETRKLLGIKSALGVYQANISEVAPVFRQQMLEAFARHGIHDGVVVEKSMTNSHLAGLAHAAFPEARFLLVHRNPMDVAFGCYKQLFSAGEQSFSYDLGHCAHAYSAFMRLAALWQSLNTLPVLRVDYEKLVGEFEETVRAMLAFLELPFEQACLAFHKNQRAVSTASASQVRQGLFTSAVGRWARYGDGLAPLRDAFRHYGVEIDG